MKNNKIKLMCLAGVFTAMVYIFTAYMHIPSYTGYTHVGDAFIYLVACMLPPAYAMAVGAVGALLADCLTGFAVWAPGSVIIKILLVLFFSAKKEKILSLRNLLALLPAAAVCIGGYYLYEVIITGNFIAPISGIPGNVTQAVFSSVLFMLLGFAFDKFNVRKHILNGGK